MRPPKKRSRSTSTDVTNSLVAVFWTALVTIIFLVIGVAYTLHDPWTAGQAKWLVSRSSAVLAYISLTLIVVMGIVMSHPRNKDTWKIGRHLLPWHLSMLPVFFVFMAMHIFMTGSDTKSGVTWDQMLFPAHVKYHPIAMMFGAASLYLVLLVFLTSVYRTRIKMWLPIHRLAWLTWACVTIHGFFGGTDTQSLWLVYVICTAVTLFTFYWRHWTNNERKMHRRGSNGLHGRMKPNTSSESIRLDGQTGLHGSAASHRPIHRVRRHVQNSGHMELDAD